MRTIGLIGGMSWESSAQYHRIVNEAVRDRLGPSHSAQLVLVSVDFAEIERLQHAGDWDALGDHMARAARQLEAAGADVVVLCTNTMHLVAEAITAATALPFLHVIDPTGTRAVADGHHVVGLLGTAFTMERPFYRDHLAEHFGLEVLIPGDEDRRVVHDVIYTELIAGRVLEASRERYREVIARLVDRGADAIVLGCTELMLLVREEDSAVPLLDTTTLHALAAVDWALV